VPWSGPPLRQCVAARPGPSLSAPAAAGRRLAPEDRFTHAWARARRDGDDHAPRPVVVPTTIQLGGPDSSPPRTTGVRPRFDEHRRHPRTPVSNPSQAGERPANEWRSPGFSPRPTATPRSDRFDDQGQMTNPGRIIPSNPASRGAIATRGSRNWTHATTDAAARRVIT